MAAKRVVPSARLMKKVAMESPIDTTGMDPAMKATLTQERNRKGLMAKLLAPFAGRGAAPAKKAKK